YHTFDGSNYILKDISLSLKKSESIAIMGPSGSGENSIMVTDTIIKLNQGLKASTKFLNKMILI
ncbi:MAG: ABC transporter ATP-binding protein, partial [Peptoniphilus lacydonensis]|nr:ABC transporter ATP-binding protein [Peptoniphilus lacydonensis]